METIKANSFMLSDWVKIKEPNKYAGAIGTIQSLSSLEGTYLAIYINDPNFGTFVTEVFCEDIEPIPLTAEILEKNGFKNIDTELDCDGSNIYWKTNNGYSINTQDINLNFVHQLQQALRLCGIIDKEIVL